MNKVNKCIECLIVLSRRTHEYKKKIEMLYIHLPKISLIHVNYIWHLIWAFINIYPLSTNQHPHVANKSLIHSIAKDIHYMSIISGA